MLMPRLNNKTILIWMGGFILSSMVKLSGGLTFPLPPPGDDVVGDVFYVQTKAGDTLSKLAIKYDMGYAEMREANPDVPAQGKLTPGTVVLIPARFILPQNRAGIVVNLAELRLYYFPEDSSEVATFPIGAGREGWETPLTKTAVAQKRANPVWIPPASIREESAKLGKPLPKVVPAGPQNPLGKYAIRLQLWDVLFHGTNLPATVGTRSTHGCMRMLPADIEYLYQHVAIGTPVEINHQQLKLGRLGNRFFLEAETPFSEHDQGVKLARKLKQLLATQVPTVDWQQVEAILNEQAGIPLEIAQVAD